MIEGTYLDFYQGLPKSDVVELALIGYGYAIAVFSLGLREVHAALTSLSIPLEYRSSLLLKLLESGLIVL